MTSVNFSGFNEQQYQDTGGTDQPNQDTGATDQPNQDTGDTDQPHQDTEDRYTEWEQSSRKFRRVQVRNTSYLYLLIPIFFSSTSICSFIPTID